MQPLNVGIRIAIFIVAVACTVGLGYLAAKAMHWAFVYVGSAGRGGVRSGLVLTGGIVIVMMMALRFHFRRRAKAARAKK